MRSDVHGQHPTRALLRLVTFLTMPFLLVSPLRAQDPQPGADSAAALAARTVTLAGVVRDTAGHPLSGAEVRAGAQQFTVTGADGRFQLSGVAPDTIQLLVRRIGYKPADVVLEAQAGLRVELAVKLVPSVMELGTIVVNGQEMDTRLWQTGFYDRQKLGVGTFFDPDDLKHFGGTVSGLMHQVPSVTVVRDEHGRTRALGRALSLTGGTSCPLSVFLDGILIRWTEDTGLDQLVNRADVLAVEVYPRASQMSSALAAYAGGASTLGGGVSTSDGARLRGVESVACGAIAIWTKPFGSE